MKELLVEGTLAPEFSLMDSRGDKISLLDFRGKKVILYFYPKDRTPGCTTEACDFRDNYQDFISSNAVVIGVSKDSIKSHGNFINKFQLPFVLLSDVDGSVCEKYGVWLLKKNFGKEYIGIVRTTFIIDEDGVITKIYRKVKVEGHIEAVLKDIL